MILVGSHVSASGGLYKAIERGESIGCTALQLFTKSNRSWFDKPISDADTEKFITTWENSSIKEIVVHAAYLINLGASNQETAKTSTKSLVHELHRCKQLGIKYLVIHPGSHTRMGEEKCIKQIAYNLDEALEQSEGVTVLLETAAGQGTNVGYTFQQLGAMRDASQHKRRVGYCLDTCHIFCAGYDISTSDGYTQTIATFDKELGLEHLKAIHVNDSIKPCNARVDRHAPLGEGTIPLLTFENMMNDQRLNAIPKLLETPSDPEMHLWKKEIKMLKEMIK